MTKKKGIDIDPLFLCHRTLRPASLSRQIRALRLVSPALTPVYFHELRGSFDATYRARLDYCSAGRGHLFRSGALFRKKVVQEHFRIFRFGPFGSLVAGRALDGGDDVQQRYAEPGDGYRAP